MATAARTGRQLSVGKLAALRRLADELGIFTITAMDQRNSLKGSDAKQAFALAETAVAYGEGAVYSAGQNGHTPPSGSQPLPGRLLAAPLSHCSPGSRWPSPQPDLRPMWQVESQPSLSLVLPSSHCSPAC